MAFSHDNQTVATGGGAGSIMLWSAQTGADIGELVGHHWGDVRSLAFREDGVSLRSVGAGGTVQSWHLSDGALLDTLVDRDGSETGTISADGTAWALAFEDNVVWWVNDGAYDYNMDEIGAKPTGLAYSAHGEYLAVGLENGNVFIWDTERWISGDASASINLVDVRDERVTSLAFSPDNVMLAVGYSSGDVDLIEVEGAGQAGTVDGHVAPVQGIVFAPDATLLVTGSSDGTIRLWGIAVR